MDKIIDRIKRRIDILNPQYQEIMNDLDMLEPEHQAGFKRAKGAVDKAFENNDTEILNLIDEKKIQILYNSSSGTFITKNLEDYSNISAVSIRELITKVIRGD